MRFADARYFHRSEYQGLEVSESLFRRQMTCLRYMTVKDDFSLEKITDLLPEVSGFTIALSYINLGENICKIP